MPPLKGGLTNEKTHVTAQLKHFYIAASSYFPVS